jgi:hypothetical protein
MDAEVLKLSLLTLLACLGLGLASLWRQPSRGSKAKEQEMALPAIAMRAYRYRTLWKRLVWHTMLGNEQKTTKALWPVRSEQGYRALG